MIYIIWEFDVEPSQIKAFEEIYDSRGAWAQLFQRSKSYHGTNLLKDCDKLGRYLSIDQWDVLVDFENFKNEHTEAYEALDRACENLTLSERKLGVFSSIMIKMEG